MREWRAFNLRLFCLAVLTLCCMVPAGSAKDSQTRLDEQLLDAAERCDVDAGRAALANGANVDAKDLNGDTPLLVNVRQAYFGQDDPAFVKLLLARNATVDAHAKDGKTPLMSAASLGWVEVVRLLLRKGAKLEAKDKEGRTPLMYAAYGVMTEIGTLYSMSDCVRVLLSRGAKVNAKDNSGQTALILAVKTDNYDKAHREAALKSARLLISRGADINAKSKNGNTALKWAKARGHMSIVKLLRSARRGK